MSKTRVEEMTYEDIKKLENKISWLLWNAFYGMLFMNGMESHYYNQK